MLFANLIVRQKEQYKLVARSIVARGKRRFFMNYPWTTGIVFWLGMNTLFSRRGLFGLEGRFLVGWLVASFFISILFGLIFSIIMWRNYERIAKLA